MHGIEFTINGMMATFLDRLNVEINMMDAALIRLDREAGQISEREWNATQAGLPVPDDGGREHRLVFTANRLDKVLVRRKAVAEALRSAIEAARHDDATWAEVRDIFDGQNIVAAAPAPDERSMSDDQWDAVVASRVLTDAAEAIDAALIAGVVR